MTAFTGYDSNSQFQWKNRQPVKKEKQRELKKKKRLLIHFTLSKEAMIVPTPDTHSNPETIYMYVYIRACVCVRALTSNSTA